MTKPLVSESRLENCLLPLSDPQVLLEGDFCSEQKASAYLFRDFEKVILFYGDDNPKKFFAEIEKFLKKGFWVCGYFSYEFGYWLEPALRYLRPKIEQPLVWLGVCKRPFLISNKQEAPVYKNSIKYSLCNLKCSLSFPEYEKKIKRIKYYLENGLTYQVNLTFKLEFEISADVFDFYLALRRAQPAPYRAFINTGTQYILSLSPELFFRIDGKRIMSRPMKGTAARSASIERDRRNKEALLKSKKIQAENVMITDLLRNDLGKICSNVTVDQLFKVEEYSTLYQVTSTILGSLNNGTAYSDIFTSLFPCGSVTGAPKIKTMEIIKILEKQNRGIYTGAIGYISPSKDTCFNVAIRTVVLNKNHGEIGIGGGIVYDSVAFNEYKEALLKSEFLTKFSYPSDKNVSPVIKQGGYF
ncbi:MAG: aminodeoxychorismate synthase component I [Candidatus Omnitrophota bacterium]